MSNYIYNYDEWLGGHAKRKTMMEKLERSLVPYDLFSSIPMPQDREALSGEVICNGNTYHYDITYDYECIGHEVYNASLKVVELVNRWEDPLLGYCNFKLVLGKKGIITIYSDHENFFQEVIDMYEKDDFAGLYANRSSYINNALARYMLLRLIEAHMPEMQPLVSVYTKEDGRISALAATEDRNKLIMYAFSKREAMDIARKLDGICPELTVIYFFNQDFEKDGNTVGYDSGCTRVISARTFYLGLPLDKLESLQTERRMLSLVSMLYNEHLEWHFDRIEKIAVNPPNYGKHMKAQKETLKQAKKKAKAKAAVQKPGLPWWEKITRTLLEDALNVIADTPTSHSDIFHFLCASNMVNAYVNQCKQHGRFSDKQVQRMYQAKRQIFSTLLRLAVTRNPNVKISLSPLPAAMANMNVEKRNFQISFRGMNKEMLDRLIKAGIDCNGIFEGHYNQPIATALYQYSYMLRWKALNNPF